MIPDIIGLTVGTTLTVLILSYLLGDNPLYRLALHVFVGVLVGYSFGVVLRDVFLDAALPRLWANPIGWVAPFILGILLIFKGFPQQAYIGNYSIAYLIGVGTAVSLSGALLGVISPQVEATGQALTNKGLLNGLAIVVGTICTLMAFTAIKPGDRGLPQLWDKIATGLGGIGRFFLIVAFGAAFAGALTASLSIFIGRVQYFINLIGF
jgi:hypothetical protein